MPIRLRQAVLCCLVALLLLLNLRPPRPASALLGSDPMAIISAVNTLRAAQGLPPYVVDQGLMAYALEHSRYQASLHTATHQHSDGSTVWQNGMDENIATGMLGYLTPEFAVYTVWSDAIHMKTMISYATGSVGAGVADDGADEYYTLDVRPGSGAKSGGANNGGGKNGGAKNGADANATPTKIIPIVPLLTVTPRADRWMIHTVGYGQSLWSVAIAYGVKMDQIRAWNSMAAGATDIYAGQKLYIIAPPNIWPTLTASPAGPAGSPEQTVTPGRAYTEEPRAATEKAAYQAAVAETPGSISGNIVLDGTPSPLTPLPTMTATASPASEQAVQGVAATEGAPVAQDGPAVQDAPADKMPVAAGILILFGGGLLLVIAFSMLRRH